MERIKNALEKARHNQSPDASFVKPVRPKSTLKVPKSQSRITRISDIQYDQTNVVALDSKWLEKNRIVAYNKHNLHSNIFDLLRTQVLSRMKEKGWRTLAIVSPTPSAGKSVISINLAMSIAHYEEKTALLVDFDLRRPSIAKYMGLKKRNCVADVLDETCDLKDALINPGMPRLVVLPAHKAVPNSAEIMASTQIKDMISELRGRYEERIVIFDLPPLLNADDAMAVLPNIDCILLVVASGMVRQKDVVESLTYLPHDRLVGTVFNKAFAGDLGTYY